MLALAKNQHQCFRFQSLSVFYMIYYINKARIYQAASGKNSVTKNIFFQIFELCGKRRRQGLARLREQVCFFISKNLAFSGERGIFGLRPGPITCFLSA